MYLKKKMWTNAKKQVVNGYQYDSGFEAQYSIFLDSELRAKRIKSYQKQVNLDLVVNGYVVCQYRIDYIVKHNDGITEYVEMKGRAFDAWKLKWKIFEALYSDIPNTKLTVIYQGKSWKPKLKKVKK